MIKKNKCCFKGQVSMEFIITIIFVISIFIFSLFIFQNRTIVNQTFSEQWVARDIANRFARNVNTVFLMDENSVLIDYFFWEGDDRKIEFGENSVRVFFDSDFFVDSPILVFFDSEIVDLNGKIFFKKEFSKVVISYE